MSEMSSDPFGNIWITSRIRMAAHAKFVRLDRLSHVVLTFYSVALLGFSVFEPHLANTPLGPYSSEISVVLSLSILCASLLVWGLNFGEKARDHRDCYLALQRLYSAPMDAAEKKAKYQDILEKHPNHSGFDNERFLFRKICIEGEKVETERGQIRMGALRVGKYLALELLSLAVVLLLISFPAIVIYVIYALP